MRQAVVIAACYRRRVSLSLRAACASAWAQTAASKAAAKLPSPERIVGDHLKALGGKRRQSVRDATYEWRVEAAGDEVGACASSRKRGLRARDAVSPRARRTVAARAHGLVALARRELRTLTDREAAAVKLQSVLPRRARRSQKTGRARPHGRARRREWERPTRSSFAAQRRARALLVRRAHEALLRVRDDERQRPPTSRTTATRRRARRSGRAAPPRNQDRRRRRARFHARKRALQHEPRQFVRPRATRRSTSRSCARGREQPARA